MSEEDPIQSAVKTVLESIGEDITREGLRETPRRVAEMYREVFSGLHQDPSNELTVGFDEDLRDMVILRDVPFFSMCEHHMLPFLGKAHIGYLPSGRVVGASKLARAVDILARRPQLQERLTTQIADLLMTALNPEGVAVVLQAEHLCMSMRGVQKAGTSIVTTATRGEFSRNSISLGQFLSLVQER